MKYLQQRKSYLPAAVSLMFWTVADLGTALPRVPSGPAVFVMFRSCETGLGAAMALLISICIVSAIWFSLFVDARVESTSMSAVKIDEPTLETGFQIISIKIFVEKISHHCRMYFTLFVHQFPDTDRFAYVIDLRPTHT